MIGAFRLAIFGFLFLCIVYFLVSVYSRSVRREKLEKKWDEEVKSGDRDAYIEVGMHDYDRSIRKKLIMLIFVIPVIVVGVMLYVTNFM
ncbi:MAG: hypothetical protein OEZ19_01685 [Paracoccaceae bacterium]|nr:hypothetical protein [Paracoccaceae bacterium]